MRQQNVNFLLQLNIEVSGELRKFRKHAGIICLLAILWLILDLNQLIVELVKLNPKECENSKSNIHSNKLFQTEQCR